MENPKRRSKVYRPRRRKNYREINLNHEENEVISESINITTDKVHGVTDADYLGYLSLSEAQEDILLSALSHCIELLDPTYNTYILDDSARQPFIHLRKIIDDKIFILSKEQQKVTKLQPLVTCYYCGLRCSRSYWGKHILQQCSYKITPFGQPKKCLYEMNKIGLKCVLCDKSCLSINKKISHDFSFAHNVTISNYTGEVEMSSIYCSVCRTTIPNNDTQCYQHFQSDPHKLLLRHYFDWYLDGVRYLGFPSLVTCLTCNENLETSDVKSHNLSKHTNGIEQKLGFYNILPPCDVWCSYCGAHFHWSTSHEHCQKSIHSYFCQVCNDTVFGCEEFANHVKECDSSKQISGETFVGDLSQTFGKAIFETVPDNTWAECYFCAMKCLKDKLSEHVLFHCDSIYDKAGSFDPCFKTRFDKSLYSLLDEMKCILCNVTCSTLNEVELHGNSDTHLKNVSKDLKGVNLNAIYCIMCQENIPNNINQLYGHIKSQKHKTLQNNFLDWCALSVRYIVKANSVLCFTCNKYFLIQDIETHHDAIHKKDDKKVHGTLKRPSPNKVWCSPCGAICFVSNLKSHYFHKCKKTLENYFCQKCDETIIGNSKFKDHMLACWSSLSGKHQKNLKAPWNINKIKVSVKCENLPTDFAICFGCGFRTHSLREHVLIQCATPYDQNIKQRGKHSLYVLSSKGIECVACKTVLSIYNKDMHDQSESHKTNLALQSKSLDESTVFCVICQENMPNEHQYISSHNNNTRHMKFTQLRWRRRRLNVCYRGEWGTFGGGTHSSGPNNF